MKFSAERISENGYAWKCRKPSDLPITDLMNCRAPFRSRRRPLRASSCGVRACTGSILMVLLLVLSAPLVRGQDARVWLERTAERYRTLESYQIESIVDVRMQVGPEEQSFEMQVVMAERPPAYLLADVVGPTVRVLVVTNEEGSYLYMPNQNRYVFSATSTPARVGEMTEDLLKAYRHVHENVVAAAVKGRGQIGVQNRELTSIIIDVVYEPTETSAGTDSTRKRLWIDETTGLILRDSTTSYKSETPFGSPMVMRETTTFTRLDVEAVPTRDLFVFVPPEGAALVEPEEIFGHGLAPGGAPPEFELSDLAGNMVGLSQMTGDVVLINLWASWCGPCREEMPILERLQQSLGGEGLRILAVNVGEEEARVRSYIREQRLSFDVLLDPSSSVGDLYGAHSLPTTVIVDRTGRIASILHGAQTAAALVQALRAAGL